LLKSGDALTTPQHYQQPLDITIGENERVFFKVTGTHSVYLTGNYVINEQESGLPDDDYEEDEMDYELGDDDYESGDSDEESDELDDIADPRVTEVGTDDEEEVPKLVKAEKKGKNKRPAEDVEDKLASLDEMISKGLKGGDGTTNGDSSSKRQAKKLKNNAGQAVAGAEKAQKNAAAEGEKATNNAKVDKSPTPKKVQFAKNLEQGPTGTNSPTIPTKKADNKLDGKDNTKTEQKADQKGKPSLGPKKIQGVEVDDKKLGSGAGVKKGDKIELRYIGKLAANSKVFDCKFSIPPITCVVRLMNCQQTRKANLFPSRLGEVMLLRAWTSECLACKSAVRDALICLHISDMVAKAHQAFRRTPSLFSTSSFSVFTSYATM
jgi:FK506-binding nuclear protein